MVAETDTYTEDLERWRARGDASLRTEDGWLALAGLEWLAEGRNRVGSDPGGEIVLDPALAPPLLAEVYLRDGVVSLGVTHPELTLGGGPPSDRPLCDDAADEPDIVALGRLSFLVIRRGTRIGLRLRDREHPARAAFPGRRWYTPRLDLRVEATFVPHPEPKTLLINSIIGEVEERPSPGSVVFTIGGQECRLDAVGRGDGGLFFNFRDATSGKETYPPGRFLTADAPAEGRVILDFNRAYNPPCAFTAFATCPLPPPQNVLAAAIPAGELAPEGYH